VTNQEDIDSDSIRRVLHGEFDARMREHVRASVWRILTPPAILATAVIGVLAWLANSAAVNQARESFTDKLTPVVIDASNKAFQADAAAKSATAASESAKVSTEELKSQIARADAIITSEIDKVAAMVADNPRFVPLVKAATLEASRDVTSQLTAFGASIDAQNRNVEELKSRLSGLESALEAFGSPPIVTIEHLTFQTNAETRPGRTVPCPPDAPNVIGGGFDLTDVALSVVHSMPNTDGKGWIVYLDNPQRANSAFTVYATCSNQRVRFTPPQP
jgi:hypothetical protein